MTEGPSVTAAAARDPQDTAGAVAQDPAGAPQAAAEPAAGPAEPAAGPAGPAGPAEPAEPAQASSAAVRQPGHPGWAAQAITGARRARASVGQATAGETADRAKVPPEDEEIEPHVRVDARLIESAILALRKPIVAATLPLEAPGVTEARAERHKLLSQIDDYLLPRLRESGAPILVALVGSTGAGKSTLVNSVVGAHVSMTGIRGPPRTARCSPATPMTSAGSPRTS